MNLRVCALNCNSITNYDRRIALSDLIRASCANVCLLSETKLKDSLNPRFLGFRAFYQSNSTQRGGTAILVDESLDTRNFRSYSGPIEATYIEIRVENSWLGFCSIYFNCRGISLNNFQSFFRGLNTKTIIGGDTNARLTRWGDTTDNANGKLLESVTLELGLSIHNPTHGTYHGPFGSSFIDKFITPANFPITIPAVTVSPSFSDHSIIAISLDLLVPKRSYRLMALYDKTNMTALNKFVERRLETLHLKSNAGHNDNELQEISTSVENIFALFRRFLSNISSSSQEQLWLSEVSSKQLNVAYIE